MPKFLGPEDDGIILLKDDGALEYGRQLRRLLPKERVWELLCAGRDSGEIEMRIMPDAMTTRWVMRSIERYFSHLPEPLPAESPAAVKPGRAKRKPGPEAMTVQRVVAEMTRFIAEGHDLDGMKGEAMAATFRAARSTCSKARRIVLSKIAEDN